MSSLAHPLPVILCGRTAAIGKPVSQLLKPEYEGLASAERNPPRLTVLVIHFIQTFEAAKQELPHVLAGRNPQSPHRNDVGTGNYSKPPRAIILGRAFDLAQVEELRNVCIDSAEAPVAWVLGDPAKAPTGPPGPNYAEEVVKVVKDALDGWKNEGGVKDGIVMY